MILRKASTVETSMNKNILIIGSSGLVGSQASHFLSNRGFNVIGVTRNNPKIRNGFSFIHCDYSNLEVSNLQSLNLNHVIFSAGDTTQFMQYEKSNSNLSREKLKFETFLKIVRQLPTLRTFIFMSSAGALYDSNQIVNEKSKLNICTDYAKLKFEFENLLIKSARQSGFVYQILRVTNLYGSTIDKEIRGGFINELINSALRQSSFTLAENFREINKNFLFIDDLLLVLEFLLNERVPQNYMVNIANENSLSLDKVLEVTLKVLADYQLEPEINLKNLNYSGNSNHEFDLRFLKDLIPAYKNTPLEQGLIKTLKSII